jgi:hypothetical protein
MKSGSLAPPTGIGALTDHLLVQCGTDDLDLSAVLRPGSGLVLCGKSSAAAGQQLLRADEPARLVLADRRAYAGRARLSASCSVSPRWIDQQRRAGMTASLTDSGYVAAGDVAGLVHLLSSAVSLGPDVVATLPLHPRWLQHDLSRLITEVRAHGAPIALVVEHPKDPYRVYPTVEGLVRLLQIATVPVLHLCSDVSALGAIAFGATAAAVGVRPALRHLYPAGGGGFSRGVEAVLFNPGLSFVHVDKLARGVAAMPDDPMWECWCSTCVGRRADWFLFASQHEQRAHTFELLLNERDHLTSAAPGPIRQQVWRAACASAEYQFTSVAVARVGWEVPPALRHWQNV